ncbi:hypothetical protein [Legionella shakespearei]|uniref:Uncharacterized protein n=1 Tax=Legionella shakespearei DSM 23087 TaxID=1122169 RepID=A0A0W0YXA8_9GAMM|nr:hypothetical protein [Legionella shakespearei]KTD61480.1 hypothetical protein Lsha_1237 [Legionella shakespearei DSM 23087]
MLTDRDISLHLREEIIEEAIKEIKKSPRGNTDSLSQRVTEFKNYYTYNLSIPAASDSNARNGDSLSISKRQERLGIVGSLFESSDDYADFLQTLDKEMTLLATTEPRKEALLSAIDSDIAKGNVFPFPPATQDIIETLTPEQRDWIIKQIGENSSFQTKLACAFLAADGDVLLLGRRNEEGDEYLNAEKKALVSIRYLLEAAEFEEIRAHCHTILAFVRESTPYDAVKNELEMMELSPTPEDVFGIAFKNKRVNLYRMFPEASPASTSEVDKDEEKLKSSPFTPPN